MSLSTAGLQHRLYLKQIEFWKLPVFHEILPANFNYQDTIIVSSGTVEEDGVRIVFQTYSCGCGPQPLVKAAFMKQEIPWEDSEFRRMLAASGKPKDTALVDQKIFSKVQRIRPAQTEEEKDLVEKVMQGHFGDNRKISFF
jgi:hypothetical protein